MQMKYLNPYRLTSRGFTLIEMAIVLMIVGLLLGGLLVPLSAQMDQRNNSATQKALSEIKEAIFGYALANGRLPCPAKANIATGSLNAGMVDCTLTTGVLPWATLGVNETDAWGNRYTYGVTSTFADATDGTGASCGVTTGVSFQLCSVGNLNVLSTAGGQTIAVNVPAVVISHGKHAAGAWTPQGTQLPVSSDPSEADNSNGGTTYVSMTTPTATFDDLVVWISPDILYNRMVSAGKLP